MLNAGSQSPPRAARLCSALGTGLGAGALLLVGQLSPGLVPPLPLPAHDRCNRRRDCFSRSCCLDPWCSARLRADPGAAESPSPPSPLCPSSAGSCLAEVGPSLGRCLNPFPLRQQSLAAASPKYIRVFFLGCGGSPGKAPRSPWPRPLVPASPPCPCAGHVPSACRSSQAEPSTPPLPRRTSAAP